MINISELNIYPVKSLRGIALDHATVTNRGLLYDREWLIVDHANRFLTQRQYPVMATITTHIEKDHLELRCDTMPRLLVDLNLNTGISKDVTIWRDQTQGIDQGIEASNWLTEIMGTRENKPLRLVRFPKQGIRSVSKDFLGEDASEVAFADGYPYLIGVEESLEHLNNALSDKVPMNRFRANIVVNGIEALEEHNIRQLDTTNGQISIGLRKPCDRCIVTTTDQRTGVVSVSREPLKTLVSQNPFKKLRGGYFGQNSILLKGNGQSLSVGDELLIAEQFQNDW